VSFLAILVALGLEQWRAFHWRDAIARAFVRHARNLERKLNGGRPEQALLATVAAVVPPVLAALAGYYVLSGVHPLLGLVWNVLVLYAVMGFRRFSHAASALVLAFRDNDVDAARRALAAWRGGYTAELSSQEIARLAIERGLVDAYRHVFAVVFWFAVLPGPAGAVLYWCVHLLAREWSGAAPGDEDTPMTRSRALFGQPARTLLQVLDWLPVRLAALSFAIVGDFEDAAYCWRMQPETWTSEEGGVPMGLLLASGAGALGVTIGGPLAMPGGPPRMRPELGLGDPAEPDMLPSAVGLVWRALILWLLVILLVTLANLAP
jgi:adenosylcobinamide-phosphate synthase